MGEGCEEADKRMKFGTVVYQKHAKGLSEEVNSFDDEIVEALNDAVGDNKTITIGLGADSEDYSSNDGTFCIKGFDNGVTILVGKRYGLSGTYVYPRGDGL